MAVQNNKKRILCLMEILLHQTDEDHILNASDLAEILKNKNIIPTACPSGVTGTRSPYPTVVKVTNEYQKASPNVWIIELSAVDSEQ